MSQKETLMDMECISYMFQKLFRTFKYKYDAKMWLFGASLVFILNHNVRIMP